MFNRTAKKGHSHLIPRLKGRACSLSSSSEWLFTAALKRLMKLPFYFLFVCLFSVFIMYAFRVFSVKFSMSIERRGFFSSWHQIWTVFFHDTFAILQYQLGIMLWLLFKSVAHYAEWPGPCRVRFQFHKTVPASDSCCEWDTQATHVSAYPTTN